MENAKCTNCGKEYFRSSIKKKYCSYECSNEYQTKRNRDNFKKYQIIHNVNCKECGKRFTYNISSRKYCSADCYKASLKRKYAKPIHNIKCKECGKWFSSSHPKRTYCSIECADRYKWRKRYIRKREQLKMNGDVDWSISLERLIKRDKSICYLCGKKVDIRLDHNHDYYPNIEHVIPISKGGTHTWDNVKLAHRKCNLLKSDKVYYASKIKKCKF